MELCKKHGVSQVVVGLPYDCEGNERSSRQSGVRVLVMRSRRRV